MSPAELDAKILAKLDGAPCILSELAERVGASAKEILKRLHVLGGMKRVACERQDGSLVWGLCGQVAPKERPERTEKPEPKRAPEPPTAGRPTGATESVLERIKRTAAAREEALERGAPPAARGHLPDPDPRGAPEPKPSEPKARVVDDPRQWKSFVVRERTYVPEIRVTPLPREVVIAVLHEDPAKSEGVCIPRDPVVLGALIDAIKQVMA